MRNSPPRPRKQRFLLCASPKDAKGKAELVAHLAAVRGTLTIWSVDEILGGDSAAASFKETAAAADAALLLLSSDFFAELESQPLAEQVLHLRQQNQQHGLRLIPILWRDCDWQAVDWLTALKPLPVDGATIARLDKAQRDMAFAQIARQLDGRGLARKGGVAPFSNLTLWGFMSTMVLLVAMVCTAALVLRSSEIKLLQLPHDGAVSDYTAAPILWKIEGIVRNARLEPLAAVRVSLPEFSAANLTNEDGFFRFAVPADHDGLVLLRAEKPADPGHRRKYKSHELYVNLGSTTLELVLEDTP